MDRLRYFDYDPFPLVPVFEKIPQEDDYVSKVSNILSSGSYLGVPPEPSPVCAGVFLGTTANAENIPLLKSMGITYILNCAGGHPMGYRRRRNKYPPESGILGYEEMPIEEWEDSDIRSFFDRAHGLIDYWKFRGGNVLLHCPGVSRSGCIAISYLCHTGTPLFNAAKVLKEKRRCVLNNDGFIKQLVTWAYDRGMVDSNFYEVDAPKFYRPLHKHRICTAHLPTFL